MEKTNKSKRVETTLRLSTQLHEELAAAAAVAGHSLNEEIIHRCQAFSQSASLADIAKQNAELKRMLQQLIDRHG